MQRRLILGIALLFIASEQVPAYDLSQHQWRHRLLFLIAPQADDPDLAAQQRDLALRADALLDRDIRLLRLLPDQGFLGEAALSAEAVRALRQQLDVTDAERLLILIGKDGGIKRRAELDTDLREILLQIDAMPMRRDEIRVKKEAGERKQNLAPFGAGPEATAVGLPWSANIHSLERQRRPSIS